MVDGKPGNRTAQLYIDLWSAVPTPAGDAKQLVVFQNTLSKMDDFADAPRPAAVRARRAASIV